MVTSTGGLSSEVLRLEGEAEASPSLRAECPCECRQGFCLSKNRKSILEVDEFDAYVDQYEPI